MDRNELLRDWVKCRRTAGGGTRVYVRSIRWLNPHTPHAEWVMWRQYGIDEIPDRGDAAAELLRDPRFFGSCDACGERKPRGWMHSATLCQTCAQLKHGVVY
jgi:hypothetical protein